MGSSPTRRIIDMEWTGHGAPDDEHSHGAGDVSAVCRKYGIELPEEYGRFIEP